MPKLKSQTGDAIVVFNGCFCPVHAGHVAALEEAKRQVEAAGMRVVAGYFAVATDSYVRCKLNTGPKLPEWMTAAARVAMCKAVAQDVGWSVSAAIYAGATECGAAMLARNHDKKTKMYSVRHLVECESLRAKGGKAAKGLSATRIRIELEQNGYTPGAIAGLVNKQWLLPAVGRRLQLYFTPAPCPTGSSAVHDSAADDSAAATDSAAADSQTCMDSGAHVALEAAYSAYWDSPVNALGADAADSAAAGSAATDSAVADSAAADSAATDSAAAAAPSAAAPSAAAPSAVPTPCREIRAVHDAGTVRVYQAYSDAIADLALPSNSFDAPRAAGVWSDARMTWIKPSAVWMAYRCGWSTMKDRRQARVLALDLDRDGFEALLAEATLAHDAAAKHAPVVVQWDPERAMDASAAGKQVFTRPLGRVRSVQIGLRGAAVTRLLDPAFVRQISDVTPQFRDAAARLQAGDMDAAAAALWPRGRCERPMQLPAAVRAVLEMDVEPEEPEAPDGCVPMRVFQE